MKFMLILNDGPTGSGPDEHARLQKRVSGWLSELKNNTQVERAYFMIPGRGMCIVDVATHEALLDLMRAWPFYKYTRWEVYPLADAKYAVDATVIPNAP